MTDTTRDLQLTNAWTQVSVDGATECSVTLEGNRAFQAVVRVAAAQPSNALATGHRLTPLTPSMPISSIKTGLKVWARALNGAADVCVS
ncbi:hypothetical protein [uncultured Aureimonas sp.]|uniref:hypothetical protein n=1 Tax=uncultured Aureimonas sp. TaxID=1604662 RepID=UPI0025E5639C|nr:hypothetical protein [uncultured Aureimonas sp.]